MNRIKVIHLKDHDETWLDSTVSVNVLSFRPTMELRKDIKLLDRKSAQLQNQLNKLPEFDFEKRTIIEDEIDEIDTSKIELMIDILRKNLVDSNILQSDSTYIKVEASELEDSFDMQTLSFLVSGLTGNVEKKS